MFEAAQMCELSAIERIFISVLRIAPENNIRWVETDRRERFAEHFRNHKKQFVSALTKKTPTIYITSQNYLHHAPPPAAVSPAATGRMSRRSKIPTPVTIALCIKHNRGYEPQAIVAH
jgi:hypothetical protein